MGQSATKDLPFDFDNFKDELLKEAHIVREMASLSYKQFLDMIKELNRIFQLTADANGRSLLFLVKGGSDTSIFWKATVRICCIRILVETKKMEGSKLLTLRQFLNAYKMIAYHIKPMIESQEHDNNDDNDSACSKIGDLHRNPLSASMILNKIGDEEIAMDMEECCICMERKPEVTLPCAHSYCLFCIEQWNVSNKTCPVCRETLENTDESWVLPDIPETSEVSAELQKALTGLTSELPDGT